MLGNLLNDINVLVNIPTKSGISPIKYFTPEDLELLDATHDKLDTVENNTNMTWNKIKSERNIKTEYDYKQDIITNGKYMSLNNLKIYNKC